MELLLKPARTPPLAVVAIVSLLVWLGGCHRAHYRIQADNEGHALIDEKTAHACEDPGKPTRLAVSAASRMFDPFDADRPPMPEDDPRSHRYMHKVDGKRGYPMWHANGDTNTAENPDWVACLPLNECGVLVLDSDTAVRLALLHSPDYQQQIETLFLSALDVSSERFRFDTQFFGGLQSFLQTDGRRRTGTGQSSTTVGVGNYSTGQRPWSAQTSFASGADLVVGVANSIVWEFSGPNGLTNGTNTLMDFSFFQPLLRGAGRDRVLERLTRSERGLLANVRAFERFRQTFYVNVTTGRQEASGVRRSGGLFGVGLGGFTGLGGGFAGLTTGNAAGAQNANIAQAGGFLGLVQDRLQIQNQEENVSRLRESLLLLEDSLVELLTTIPADPQAIPQQRLQIAQARQQLLTQQTNLLNLQVQHQVARDGFMRTLGLPPYVCIEIRDPLLETFQLIRYDLRQRRSQLAESRQTMGDTNTRILELTQEKANPKTGVKERQLVWSDQLGTELKDLRDSMRPIAELQRQLVTNDMVLVKEDIDVLRELIPKRTSFNQRIQGVYTREKDQICGLLPLGGVDDSLFEIEPIQRLPDQLTKDFGQLKKRIEGYGQKIHETAAGIDLLIAKRNLSEKPAGEKSNKSAATTEKEGTTLFETVRDKAVLATQDLLSSMTEDILSLQLLQARARSESIILPEVDIDARSAVEIARRNRHDWMNARAALVDAWRLIEFNADDLESSLDVTFSGSLDNVGTDPFDFREAGRLRVGLRWDAPLTRLQERNTYRQSLIEFQQARRSFYRFEDGVWTTLRGELRQAKANEINFELQRLAVRIAAEQVGLNEDLRQLREARGLSSGPTAAADIIRALDALLNAQNNLLNLWVNFEVTRRGIDLDMGTMQLTPDGLWLDPGAIRPDTVGEAVAMAAIGSQPIDCAVPQNFEEIPLDYVPLESVIVEPPSGPMLQ